nr:class I SAM-dependent methyltransferase [Candidatus Njordarchaeota archaeon]
MVHAQPDLVHGIPGWRISLQDYVVDYVLSLKDVDFESAKILDLGCGLGYTLARLSHFVPQGATLVGIDITRETTDRAWKLLEKIGNKSKVNIKCVSAERTPFSNEYFDIIVSNLSFSVFDRPEKVATETVRILKPDGKLIATEVNKDGLLGKIGELVDSVSGHLYYSLYSPNELTKLLAKHGLKLKKELKVPLKIKVLNHYMKLPFNVAPVFLLELSKRPCPH